MSDKTFKQQVEEIQHGHCPKETDALYPCPMLDEDFTDCWQCKINRILAAHNAELDRIAKEMPTINDEIITYELDHAHEPCGLEFRDEPKIRAVIKREKTECQAYVLAERAGK